MAAPRVWIVPVNFNGLLDTRKCLRSLAELATPASVVRVSFQKDEASFYKTPPRPLQGTAG